ncbi:MAG: divergent polysaccharide deacetylase family protein [Candidatus Omnitrophica bacterium]|nr:divergent polysaccharide deacetylase family protein [Candidatus Omnitrophota bacterium]
MYKNDKEIAITFIAGVLIGALALGLFIKFFMKKPPAPPVRIKKTVAAPIAKPAARVAIILDDFGYNYKNVEAVFKIRRPVTFSVLPNLTYSRTISRQAQEMGYKVILHLPLEPYERDRIVKPELGTITVDMKPEQVGAVFSKDLESTPGAAGVSNHQGSEATENEPLMKAVFVEIKKRGLFFVDSLVTNRSVCKKVAKDCDIRFASRDIFLDNKEDFEYISGQMQRLIKLAKKKGFAVGIGHDRTATVAALARLMPDAEKNGIKFVFVSELVK